MKYGHEYVRILKLGIPILVGQLGSVVTGFVDNMMVGHYTTASLAAASFCNNFYNTAILACLGFTYGITPLVGALYARRDSAGIGSVMRTALRVNTIFCVAVTAVMAILYFFLDRMGQPGELLPLIRPYYLTCLAGLIPLTLFNVFAQWSYGINNTAMPMWIILGANVLNVAGNYMLIYGAWGMPELGLTGAGLSTLTARVVCAVAIVGIFAFAGRNREYRKGYASDPGKGCPAPRIWRTSLPVSVQMGCETAAFSGSAVLCGILGTLPLAAFQVIVVIGTLGFCIYYAIGAAVAVRVANARGAGDMRGMRTSAWAGYHVLLAVMLLSSLTFIFGGHALISMFTNDAAVVGLASTLIFPLVMYQLGDATQINFANALRGTSNVMPMLWIAVVSYLIIGLPSSYLLAFTCGLGVYGIVLSFSVSLFLAGALYLVFFMRTTRRQAASFGENPA